MIAVHFICVVDNDRTSILGDGKGTSSSSIRKGWLAAATIASLRHLIGRSSPTGTPSGNLSGTTPPIVVSEWHLSFAGSRKVHYEMFFFVFFG